MTTSNKFYRKFSFKGNFYVHRKLHKKFNFTWSLIIPQEPTELYWTPTKNPFQTFSMLSSIWVQAKDIKVIPWTARVLLAVKNIPCRYESRLCSKTRKSTLPSSPKRLLDKFCLGGRFNPPEAAFAWLLLWTGNFDKIPIQRQIVSDGVLK